MNNLIGKQNEGGDGLIYEDEASAGATVAIVKDARYLNVMAAAPELLASLKELVDDAQDGYFPREMIAAAWAAISKAEEE